MAKARASEPQGLWPGGAEFYQRGGGRAQRAGDRHGYTPHVTFFFFSSRRRHTRFDCDWSSDVCSSDLRYSRGYIVIAPEYRGSIGYGKTYYDAIDYGGNEVDDVVTAVELLKAKYPQVEDRKSVV